MGLDYSYEIIAPLAAARQLVDAVCRRGWKLLLNAPEHVDPAQIGYRQRSHCHSEIRQGAIHLLPFLEPGVGLELRNVQHVADGLPLLLLVGRDVDVAILGAKGPAGRGRKVVIAIRTGCSPPIR